MSQSKCLMNVFQNQKANAATEESPVSLLMDIPPADYRNYNDWLGMAGRCKAAGIPFESFHEWSKGDPQKYEGEESCHKAWSLDPSESQSEAIASLRKIASRHIKPSTATMPLFEKNKAILDAITVIKEVHPDLRKMVYSLGCKHELNKNASWFEEGEDELPEILENMLRKGLGASPEIFWQLNEVQITERCSVKTDSVKTFRWVLLESDDLSINEQFRLLREIPLPLFAGIFSGGKSIHAIIHIGASDRTEYRRRVQAVYRFAQGRGLTIDENCKSLGRWSRFPVGIRGDNFQYPVIVNRNYRHYEEWAAENLPNSIIPPNPISFFSKGSENPSIPATADELSGGKPMLRFHHIEKFISTDPGFKGEIKFNDLTRDLEFSGFSWINRRFGDNMCQMLADELSAALKPFYCGITHDLMMRLIMVVGLNNRYHPIEDRLAAEVWDGQDRISRLCDTLTPMDDFSRNLIRKWLIQCYAMLKNTDGDYGAEGVLTLQGSEGIGKTSFFRALAPDIKCFQEGISIDVDNKDSLMRAVKCWIVEIGECDYTTRKKQALLKAFITSNNDSYRGVYEKSTVAHPRTTSFCATVNSQRFLNDGENRRWWLIPVTSINLHALHELHKEVWQLWAQIKQEWDQNSNAFRLNESDKEELVNRNKNAQEKLPYEIEIEELFDWEANPQEWQWKPVKELRVQLDVRNDAVRFGKAMAKIIRTRQLESKQVNGYPKVKLPPPFQEY